jgi:transposase
MRLTSKAARDFRWQTVIRLYEEGKKQGQIAQSLLIAQSSVSRIISQYKHNPGAIATKGNTGSKKRLSDQALEQVSIWASRNAEEFGFEGQYWTRARFGQLIKDKLGIDYQLSSIGNILKHLKITLQKPLLKDYRQKAEQVEQWRKESLPAIKKS